MKKYNTKPIDFTGCHPVIAEALKRGEAIECWVWNDNTLPKKAIMTVTGYEIGGGYPYRIATCFNSRYAEPITIIAAAPEMFAALIAAIEWIEDDRFDDDYISEGWYHDAVAAVRMATCGGFRPGKNRVEDGE